MTKIYLTLEELQDCTDLAHDWSRSYDFKDWELLRSLLTQVVLVDYRKTFLLNYNPAMPINDFVDMMADPGPKGLGNPAVKTQHLLGAPRFEKKADGSIDGHWLIRAAHYNEGNGKQMYSQAITTLQYKKEDGALKISGVIPQVNWEVDPTSTRAGARNINDSWE